MFVASEGQLIFIYITSKGRRAAGTRDKTGGREGVEPTHPLPILGVTAITYQPIL